MTESEAILTGKLINGTPIKGADSVKIVRSTLQQTVFVKFFAYLGQFIQNIALAISSAVIK